ncbi:MAG: hypothetical protein AAB547_00130 [Patescibacteria group bacterium]
MAKGTKIKSEVTDSATRLQEIAEMRLGTLPDETILSLLSERTRLLELQRAYEERQREEAEILALEKKRREEKEKTTRELRKKQEELEAALAELNRLIIPDKADEELLELIARRKEIEKTLGDLGREALSSSRAGQEKPSAIPAAGGGEDVSYHKRETVPGGKEVLTAAPVMEAPISVEGEKEKEEFGKEGIRDDEIKEGSEFHRYLDQLKNNIGSLGTLLQEMPADAKKNKAFMLKVAEIDPAYAMHYADLDTLKRNEDFNIRVASLRNPRNSGNALSEMLPEARTSKVVLAAVKRDYRNVRFIQPNMDDYDEMMRIAKKAALERVKDLKEATDIELLIPRPLQQDKEFMTEVKESIVYG